MSSNHLGIEIGGTKLQVVAGDAEGNIRWRARAKVESGRGGEGIRGQLEELLRQARAQGDVGGIGVGFGGPVDRKRGVICCSHQVEGWADFPLRTWIEEQAGARTVIENDANTAALAEAIRGAGQGLDPVFYVTLGSGVGGGLVAGGRIYHGAIPGEAEIGHLRMDRDGRTVESRCSGWAVDRRIREEIARHPESHLRELCQSPPGGESRYLATALTRGDRLAGRLLSELGTDLAWALSHVVHLVHPSAIVLGGGLALMGEPLSRAVSDALPQHLMEAFRPGPKVVLAALKEDAVPVGALLLAGERG